LYVEDVDLRLGCSLIGIHGHFLVTCLGDLYYTAPRLLVYIGKWDYILFRMYLGRMTVGSIPSVSFKGLKHSRSTSTQIGGHFPNLTLDNTSINVWSACRNTVIILV
jgi:hypothetical protein